VSDFKVARVASLIYDVVVLQLFPVFIAVVNHEAFESNRCRRIEKSRMDCFRSAALSFLQPLLTIKNVTDRCSQVVRVFTIEIQISRTKLKSSALPDYRR
jgi:hypothetical protein